jgi:hypothetical protein
MTNGHHQLCDGDEHPFSTNRCLFTPTTNQASERRRAVRWLITVINSSFKKKMNTPELPGPIPAEEDVVTRANRHCGDRSGSCSGWYGA